jgi:ribonuclease BN (tRNA processing enzyme)
MLDDDTIIDCPNGMCKYLLRQGISPHDISNVLITHFHGDHYFDMPFFLLIKSKGNKKKVNIYCSTDGKRKINKLLRLAFPHSGMKMNKELNLTYIAKKEFRFKNYRVSKVKVDHGDMKPAYGYIIKSGTKTIGFAGDTTYCKGLEYLASQCDYLFTDCMFIEATDKHMGIDKLSILLDKYPNCIFIVSHLENDTRVELKKLNLDRVIVPNDGTLIDIE